MRRLFYLLVAVVLVAAVAASIHSVPTHVAVAQPYAVGGVLKAPNLKPGGSNAAVVGLVAAIAVALGALAAYKLR